MSNSKWPRNYLLRLYAEAVANGCIIVEPITETQARSLTATFYRLRRRSDKQNAYFIPPEYHLVTILNWRPTNGGQLPIVYTSLPDGEQLPPWRAASPDEVQPQPQLPPATVHQPLIQPTTGIDPSIEFPGNLEAYIDSLEKK